MPAKKAKRRANGTGSKPYDPVAKKKYNDAYTAKKKAERLAATKPEKAQPAGEVDVEEARRAKQRAYQQKWYAKRKALVEAAKPKRNGNGTNGHALAEWKPGKGSISVPQILAEHGGAPRSARHTALVERALGLIEAGLVLISEELRRK